MPEKAAHEKNILLTEGITTSDGQYRKYPKFLYKSEKKLKKDQRALSKKQRGSVMPKSKGSGSLKHKGI